MNPDDDDTIVASLSAPSVLAIACSLGLVTRCHRAVERIGVDLCACSFVEGPTMVAKRWPMVIVTLEDLFAFDPAEFVALARDVQASLVRVAENVSVPMLELLLSAAIDATTARRGELLAFWDRRNRNTMPPSRARRPRQ
jgi:hypothetical protein